MVMITSYDCEGTLRILQIMSVDWMDPDQTVPQTPMSSFVSLDMVSIETPMPTGQPVITSQVPTQATTKISTNVTNPLINSTNQDACGHPTHYEWVWF